MRSNCTESHRPLAAGPCSHLRRRLPCLRLYGSWTELPWWFDGAFRNARRQPTRRLCPFVVCAVRMVFGHQRRLGWIAFRQEGHLGGFCCLSQLRLLRLGHLQRHFAGVEQALEIVQAKFRSSLQIRPTAVDCLLEETGLGCLELKDRCVHAVLNDQSVDVYLRGLSNSVDSLDCLFFHCRIPPEIKHVEPRGRHKIQTHTTCSQ
mmetsp:Transcript_9147/g.25534  ORF Transcript_9147/g.25534 Transcript_9147/m.25534 type:complete len:205 (+) Transcript_9147:1121-1735(+)